MEPIYPTAQDNNISSCDEYDTLFSNRSLRMFKLLTPLLPCAIRPTLAIFIQLQELQITMKQLRTNVHQDLLFAQNPSEQKKNSMETLKLAFDRISPLLHPDEQKEINKIKQMFQAFETYKQLEPYMSLFSQMASAFNTDHTEEYTNPCADQTDFHAEHYSDDHTHINPLGMNVMDIMSMMNPMNSDTMENLLNPDMLNTLSGLMQAFSVSAAEDTSPDNTPTNIT